MNDRDPIAEARVKWDDAELGDRNFDKLKAAFEEMEKAAKTSADDLQYEIDWLRAHLIEVESVREDDDYNSDGAVALRRIENGQKGEITDFGQIYDASFVRVTLESKAGTFGYHHGDRVIVILMNEEKLIASRLQQLGISISKKEKPLTKEGIKE